jgi:aerobic carbon-monoxide dehydrogenase small subunit
METACAGIMQFLEPATVRFLYFPHSHCSRPCETAIHKRSYGMAINVSMTVNGKAVSAEIDPRTLLVQFIREHLMLTGTHVGCDTLQCGACTVIVNGNAVKSCSALAAQFQGAQVTTIEGISGPDGAMHPMQAAFKECHGLQCGFCTPGMIMCAIDLVERHPGASEKAIREQLKGNMCRCTGYHNIVKAVQTGAANMGKD